MSSFAIAREWIIGIVLAFMIPFTVYYGVDVYYSYIQNFPYPEISGAMTEEERNSTWALRTERAEKIQKTLFYASLIVGITALIIGNFILHAYLSLTIGLTLGGLFTLIMGYFMYWQHFGLLIKFGSLIFAIILLVFIAMKKLTK